MLRGVARPDRPALPQRLLPVVILLTLGALVPTASSASSVRSLSLDQLVEHAELVFEGRVVDVRAREESASGAIHTYVRFEVLDVVHGSEPGETLTLRFLGGRVGDRRLEVADASVPEAGERGIYFVESTSRALVSPLLGWAQGRLPMERDAEGGWRVTSAAGAPVVATERAPRVRALRLSTGLAQGLVAEPGAPLERALSPEALERAMRRRAPSAREPAK